MHSDEETTSDKDDYKVTIRPSVISWRINHEYLDVISDFDANLCFENFISPDFNRSWKDLHIFADLNCFYDLDEILDKAKKEKAPTKGIFKIEERETVITKILTFDTNFY